MPAIAIIDGLTSTHAEAQNPPGTLFRETHPTYGERIWVYVQNKRGSALAAGHVLSRAAADYTAELCPANAPASRVVAVAQHAIPNDYWGFALRSGMGQVLADTGGFTADSSLIVGDADGTADVDATQTTAHFGLCLETVLAGATGLCQIDCRG